MDERRNPYAPGAGTPPPELAGRGALIERAAIALDRIRAGRSARSFVFYGLRGVGKTVLLNRVRQGAEGRGIACVQMEAPEDRSLPALLVPPLRAALIRLSGGEAVRAKLGKALTALAGFAGAMKMKHKDLEFNLDFKPPRTTSQFGVFEVSFPTAVDRFITLWEMAGEVLSDSVIQEPEKL